MGKNSRRNAGQKGKSSSYEHVHTHNPKAHNSEERRIEALRKVHISRLTKAVERLKHSLTNYVPPSIESSYKVQKLGL